MSDQTLTGLGCPRCGGMVPIPEGQAIVICPYCDLRSAVSSSQATPAASAAQAKLAAGQAAANTPPPTPGEALAQPGTPSGLGVRRYQAPLRVTQEAALAAFHGFFVGKMAVARDAQSQSKISEVFVVHLPFWAAWGRGAAYAFGQQKVGSGDHSHYEAREKKVVREMSWNTPACEVGEFGVRQIGLGDCPLEPFNADSLHRSGMVFEPVGSEEEALEQARQEFETEIKDAAELSRVAQLFTRILNPRLGLVYYPMWVVRYNYRGRVFQVVVDGYDGKVLYGKAPGSVFYRAAALVGGMAVGALLTIDGPALLLSILGNSSSNSDNGGQFWAVLIVFLIGLGILWWAYRTYRFAEHYEYQRYKEKGKGGLATLKLLDSIPTDGADLEKKILSLAQINPETIATIERLTMEDRK